MERMRCVTDLPEDKRRFFLTVRYLHKMRRRYSVNNYCVSRQEWI
jgi:hypothetical protein